MSFADPAFEDRRARIIEGGRDSLTVLLQKRKKHAPLPLSVIIPDTALFHDTSASGGEAEDPSAEAAAALMALPPVSEALYIPSQRLKPVEVWPEAHVRLMINPRRNRQAVVALDTGPTQEEIVAEIKTRAPLVVPASEAAIVRYAASPEIPPWERQDLHEMLDDLDLDEASVCEGGDGVVHRWRLLSEKDKDLLFKKIRTPI